MLDRSAAFSGDISATTLLWLMIPTYCIVVFIYFGVNIVSFSVVILMVTGFAVRVLDKLQLLPFLR